MVFGFRFFGAESFVARVRRRPEALEAHVFETRSHLL